MVVAVLVGAIDSEIVKQKIYIKIYRVYMAWVDSILKLEVLYTKRMAAELTRPRVRGMRNPVIKMVRE